MITDDELKGMKILSAEWGLDGEIRGAAKTMVPKLIAEVDRLREENIELKAIEMNNDGIIAKLREHNALLREVAKAAEVMVRYDLFTDDEDGTVARQQLGGTVKSAREGGAMEGE